MSSQGRTPIITLLQPEVSVYLRSSQKRAHLMKLSQEIEYQQILRTISEKVKLPSQQLVLFFKGERLSPEQKITLTDKSIIHYVNLDRVQKTIINLHVKRLEGDKMITRFQVESKSNIKEFIDGKMQEVFKQNSEQIFLVYTGKQLDASKTFQQQFIEDQSEILCVNMNDSQFLVPQASIISHHSRQLPQKTNPEIQLKPGRSYMENFHKKPQSQNGSIRSNNAGAANNYKMVNISKQVSKGTKKEDGETIFVAPVPGRAKEETAQPSLHSAPKRNLEAHESNDGNVIQINEPMRNLADEGYSLIEQIKRKLNDKSNVESEQAIPENEQKQKDSSQLQRNGPSHVLVDSPTEPQVCITEATPVPLQQPANVEESTVNIQHLEQKRQGEQEKPDLVKCFFFENKPESPLSKICQKFEIDSTPAEIICQENIQPLEKQQKIKSSPPEVEQEQEPNLLINNEIGRDQKEIILQNMTLKRQFTNDVEESKKNRCADEKQQKQTLAPVDLQVFTLHSAKSYEEKYNTHPESSQNTLQKIHEENHQEKGNHEEQKIEQHAPIQPSLLQAHQQNKAQSIHKQRQVQQIATEFNSADSLPSASDELPRDEGHAKSDQKQPIIQQPKVGNRNEEKILVVSVEEENQLEEAEVNNIQQKLRQSPAQQTPILQNVPQEIVGQRQQQPKEIHQIKEIEHRESDVKELNSEGPRQHNESFKESSPIPQEKSSLKEKDDKDLHHQTHNAQGEEDNLLDQPTIKLNQANFNHQSPQPEQQTLHAGHNDSLSEKSLSQPIYPQSEESKTPINQGQSDSSQQDPSQDQKPRSNPVSNKQKEQLHIEKHEMSAHNSKISQKAPSLHDEHEHQQGQNAMTHMDVMLNKDNQNQSQQSQGSFQKVTVPLQDRIDFKAGDLIYSGELNINETENMMGHILSDYSHLINKKQEHQSTQPQTQ